jgi:hypothetical protein
VYGVLAETAPTPVAVELPARRPSSSVFVLVGGPQRLLIDRVADTSDQVAAVRRSMAVYRTGSRRRKSLSRESWMPSCGYTPKRPERTKSAVERASPAVERKTGFFVAIPFLFFLVLP